MGLVEGVYLAWGGGVLVRLTLGLRYLPTLRIRVGYRMALRFGPRSGLAGLGVFMKCP
jgi:hypothetical protein